MRHSFYINILFFIALTLIGCKKEEEMLQVPEVTTFSVSDIDYQAATCGGSANSVGSPILSKGICWSTKPTPTIVDSISMTETENGSFTIYLNNLKSDSTYYLRAFATNKIGIGYGSIMRFKTKRSSISVKTKQTNIISNLLICGGDISTTSDVALTRRGVCWSLAPYPTIEDSCVNVTTNSNNFYAILPNLKPNSLYYLRAYASSYDELIYGENITFKTRTVSLLVSAPTITQTTSSFVCGGTVTSSQPSTIISRGICWSNTGLPTINDNKTSEGTGNGYFESTITKLSGISSYYIRTYVTDSEGTVYGDIESSSIGLPIVQTVSIVKSGTNTASFQGQIITEGNAPITEYGYCFSSSSIPTLGNCSQSQGSSGTTNSFNWTIHNFTQGRTYFIRSYAKNSFGTAYGNVIIYLH